MLLCFMVVDLRASSLICGAHFFSCKNVVLAGSLAVTLDRPTPYLGFAASGVKVIDGSTAESLFWLCALPVSL